MLILNLSARAAEHLFPGYQKGRHNDILRQNNGWSVAEVAGSLARHENKSMVMVVHAVSIGRSVCLVAIDYDTRQVHVIHQVKKGDVALFITRLQTRFIHAVAGMCRYTGMMSHEDIDDSITQYFEENTAVAFYLRTDRSCNTHIAQVVSDYRQVVREEGFPEDDTVGLFFDMEENTMLRTTRESREYFVPMEKMLEKYLTHYSQFTRQEVQKAVTRLRCEPENTRVLH